MPQTGDMPSDAPTTATVSLADLAAADRGTRTSHAAILAHIERLGTGLSVTEIAHMLRLTPSVVRRYVTDLHNAGYLGTGITSTNAAAYYRTTAKDPSA